MCAPRTFAQSVQNIAADTFRSHESQRRRPAHKPKIGTHIVSPFLHKERADPQQNNGAETV
jgi:hypothetical protein